MNNETLAEIDMFRVMLAASLPTSAKADLEAWLAKIRAHVEADGLERQRLQGKIMLSAVGTEGQRLFDEETVMRVLELKPGWELAPQHARWKARLMPPSRICGKKLDEDVCHRAPEHTGKHCPIAGCEVDHG